MELPRKDSNWELIALLTSPLTCYRLVTEKWVLLLSMAFGPERDARFFFVDEFPDSTPIASESPFPKLTSMDIQAKRTQEKIQEVMRFSCTRITIFTLTFFWCMIKYLHKKIQFVLRCPSGLGAFYTMANKSYKSYLQQLNILHSRGMVIGKWFQGSRVMHIHELENLKTK